MKRKLGGRAETSVRLMRKELVFAAMATPLVSPSIIFRSPTSFSASPSCFRPYSSTSPCIFLPLRAHLQDRQGGSPDDTDQIADLESALGIEPKTVRKITPNGGVSQRRPQTVLEAMEEAMRKNQEGSPPESQIVQKIRGLGDWLIDKTENTGGQDNVVIFAFAFFPIWTLYLLVASGAIQLPIDLPFLHH